MFSFHAKDFTEVPSKYLYSIELDDVKLSENIFDAIKSHELNPLIISECQKLRTIHRCLIAEANNEEDKIDNSVTTECCESHNQVGYDRDNCVNIGKENCDNNLADSDEHNNDVDNFKDLNPCYKGDNNTKLNVNCPSRALDSGDKKPNTYRTETLHDLCCNRENSFEEKNVLLTLADIEFKFFHVLQDSVKKRVENVPKYYSSSSSVGILFSGGIDSVVLAALADR